MGANIGSPPSVDMIPEGAPDAGAAAVSRVVDRMEYTARKRCVGGWGADGSAWPVSRSA